jgi:Mlc titration factor MtfA (ptsG expression regulator)
LTLRLEVWLPLLAVGGVLLCLLGLNLRRRYVRGRLAAESLAAGYVAILEQSVPMFARVPAEHRSELEGQMNVFLNEKRFIGCDGLDITDEIRVTIAFYACLLVLNRSASCFPGFSSILVYADTFEVPDVRLDGDIEIHGEAETLGQSWTRGPVVLSWADVVGSSAAGQRSLNVVIHEFAHKLDEENAEASGLPLLRDRSQCERWTRAFVHAYASLERRVEEGEDPVMDEYALESPAEFFAVATEAFFCRPLALRAEFPGVYAQLRTFYCLDPARWSGVDRARARISRPLR